MGWVLCRGLRFVSRLTTGIEHRGLTHSLAFAALVGCLIGGLAGLLLGPETAVYLGVSAGAGVVAALLGDLVTLASLKFMFWPFTFQITIPRWARIKTGGLVEGFVVLPGVSALTLLGVVAMCGVSLGVVPGV